MLTRFSVPAASVWRIAAAELRIAPLFVIGALTHDPVREIIWGVAALADLAVPTVRRRQLARMQLDSGHLTERFGLFVLIAIGESVVAAGVPAADSEHLSAAVLVAVALAFCLTAGLWWVHFHFAADAILFSMETSAEQATITRHVLSYGHLGFIAAVVCVAVGVEEAIAEPTHHLSWPFAVLLIVGCAVYLATFGYTRWQMFRLVSKTRLLTAVVMLAALPIAPHLPALATLALAGAIVAGLNVIEYLRVRRDGRRSQVAASAGEPAS